MYDLTVRGGKLVTASGVTQTDLAIAGGRLVGLEVTASAREEIDASGLHIFPGLIDSHVHFNEPGRADWEGIATGSAALSAGGGTVFIDMPLNSDPPLLTAEAFRAKAQAARGQSLTDYAFWGGLTPDNLHHLDELADLGVIGFKAFMANSGIAEFKAADDISLIEGMKKAANLGLPVAVHAESEAISSMLTAQARAQGKQDIRAYLDSRPILAELEAINRALLFAEETNCALHIVHVSSARGISLITEAKQRGVNVSCETCPHYLYFNEADISELGAVAKCAPPLRPEAERLKLLQMVLNGEVDMIASDHSPSSPDLKRSDNFFEVWGGVAGVQSSLAVLLGFYDDPGLSLEAISRLTAVHPAERFNLKDKGKLELGYHADFSLVDLKDSFTLRADEVYTRHKLSPYLGKRFKGRVKQTFLRGHCIYDNGRFVKRRGQLLKPDTH